MLVNDENKQINYSAWKITRILFSKIIIKQTIGEEYAKQLPKVEMCAVVFVLKTAHCIPCD